MAENLEVRCKIQLDFHSHFKKVALLNTDKMQLFDSCPVLRTLSDINFWFGVAILDQKWSSSNMEP